MSYDRSLLRERERERERETIVDGGLCLEAAHIISSKHSILAGRQGDRTINIT